MYRHKETTRVREAYEKLWALSEEDLVNELKFLGHKSERSPWSYPDSSLTSFDESFQYTLPKKIGEEHIHTLSDFLNAEYPYKHLAILELGGPARALAFDLSYALSTPYKHVHGVALTHDSLKTPKPRHHTTFNANLFSHAYHLVTEHAVLPPVRALRKNDDGPLRHGLGTYDVLFLRMKGPTYRFTSPSDQRLLMSAMTGWYDLQNKNATAFLQLPPNFPIGEFEKRLKKLKCFVIQSDVRMTCPENKNDATVADIFIRVTKLGNAPSTYRELKRLLTRTK